MDSAFKSSLTSISIGPGICGIERGVGRVARLRHLAYVEIEAFIVENLVAQMERGVLDPAVIWSDCKTFPCEPFRGLVDILFAGYPCQPFSTAGKRKGVLDPRHLFPFIERAVGIIRPRICFFENVRGHVTCGLPEVIASLEGLGYRVHWGIFSAEETGATHKRERVFIMAYSENDRRKGESWRTGSKSVGHGEGLGNTELQPINSSIGWIRTKSDSASELADTRHIRQMGDQYQPKEQQEEYPEEFSRSNKLADSINNGHSNGLGKIQSEKAEIEREAHGEEWNQEVGERVRDESKYSSNVSAGVGLADSCEQRLEERTEQSAREEFEAIKRGGIVARPGQSQQAWEHPRIISREVESTVGLSAHGYHFREDVLRALGNSVYEDTAELAFRDLLRKHGIEI